MPDASGELVSPAPVAPEDPARKTVWGDLPQLDYDSPKRDEIRAYFEQVLQHCVDLGFDGFRCDAAYKVPATVWHGLIDAAKAPFCTETLGAPFEAVPAVADVGFDYLLTASSGGISKARGYSSSMKHFAISRRRSAFRRATTLTG